MKLSTAKIIGDILLAIKINRIEDKDAKAVLMNNHLVIRRAMRDVNADREEIARKFREDWADEIGKAERSEECKRAEDDAKAAIVALYEQDASIELKPVPASLLYNPELWGENDTIGQIENSVEFLIENGVAVQ